MINVAIIGAGEIVKTFHLPAWKKIKGIKIVGIVDKKVNKAKLLAKNYKIPKAYHNIDFLFKNERYEMKDKKKVEMRGNDPRASRMLSERSTI